MIKISRWAILSSWEIWNGAVVFDWFVVVVVAGLLAVDSFVSIIVCGAAGEVVVVVSLDATVSVSVDVTRDVVVVVVSSFSGVV